MNPPADAAFQAVFGVEPGGVAEKGAFEVHGRSGAGGPDGFCQQVEVFPSRCVVSAKSSSAARATSRHGGDFQGIEDEGVHAVEVLHPPDVGQPRAGDAAVAVTAWSSATSRWPSQP